MSKETLLLLKAKMEIALELKQASDKDGLKNLYQELIPHLISLRREQRFITEGLEPHIQKKKELYQRLSDIQQTCESHEFEAACLTTDVEYGRQGLKGTLCEQNGTGVDHETRMKDLDTEIEKRKDLQKKLAQITEETRKIEISCTKKEEQLVSIKPFIETLLAKSQPVLTIESSSTKES